MLFGMNVEKSKRSLEVRNEIIELISNEFDLSFGYSFNDLYKVKGGVVRRLKGGLSRRDYSNVGLKEYNDNFNKVKEFVENLNIEGFKIELNKRKDYGWYGYYRMMENGFEGNFEDYKKFCLDEEGCIIMKIKWDV